MNVEEDEAGRLRAFRMRFGRGWDAEGTETETEDGEAGDGEGRRREVGDQADEESLLDLITGFGQAGGAGEGEMRGEVVGVGREKRGGKGKGRR